MGDEQNQEQQGQHDPNYSQTESAPAGANTDIHFSQPASGANPNPSAAPQTDDDLMATNTGIVEASGALTGHPAHGAAPTDQQPAEEEPGSGTGRYGSADHWTQTGDGTDYPGSYGVGPIETDPHGTTGAHIPTGGLDPADPAAGEPQPFTDVNQVDQKVAGGATAETEESTDETEPLDAEEMSAEDRFHKLCDDVETIKHAIDMLLQRTAPDAKIEQDRNTRIATETKVPWEPGEDNLIAGNQLLTPNQKVQAHLAVNNVQA